MLQAKKVLDTGDDIVSDARREAARILDEAPGTGAVSRVLLDSADGGREWGTIGVSENIIEASWEALVDSLEYAFQ